MAPAWLQIAALSVGILGTFGGTWFALFVIWPSIRRQNELAVKMEAFFQKVEQRGIDKIIEGL